jgi:hypothetical protein
LVLGHERHDQSLEESDSFLQLTDRLFIRHFGRVCKIA